MLKQHPKIARLKNTGLDIWVHGMKYKPFYADTSPNNQVSSASRRNSCSTEGAKWLNSYHWEVPT